MRPSFVFLKKCEAFSQIKRIIEGVPHTRNSEPENKLLIMKTRAFLTLAVFTAVFSLNMATSPACPAQNDRAVSRMIETGTSDNRAMEHLDVLANRIGGRPIGSDAYDDAVAWCAEQFREWGLEVQVQEVGELPVGFNRGPWSGRMLGGSGESLHFATPSYTVGTKGVQRGHVVREPQSEAQFEAMKGRLKGAWVLIGGRNDGWPIDWSRQGDSVRLEARKWNREHPDDRKQVPALFYREMVEAGILGIIQSSDVPIRALYDRKNLYNMDFDHLAPVPDIKLDSRQYDEIASMVDRREYFQLEFDIRNHFRPGPVKYHNVIAVIKGSRYPDEYVIAGGHLDSFDVASGAVDCGSGVAPVMEAARIIASSGAKPKRSLMFCLWAGEEFGLLGSKFFVENRTVPLEKISNYFNRDYTPFAATGVTVPEAMYDDFVKAAAPLEGASAYPFTVSKREGEPGERPRSAGGSDHAYFAMEGVPTVSFRLSDPEGNDFSYGEIWHTERDNYEKSIAPCQEQSALVTAIVMYGLGNLDHLLSREGLYKD